MAQIPDPAAQDRFDKLMASLPTVWHDKLDVVARLLNAGNVDLSQTDAKGRTPLHVLAESYTGHDYDLEVAKLLLSRGAKINAQMDDGRSALHAAVAAWLRTNKPGMVMLLLENGADINMRDRAGKTAFDLALEKRTTAAEKQSLTDFFNRYSSMRRQEAAAAQREALQPVLAARRDKQLLEKAKRAPRLGGRKP
jgi:ankyrin repeat protein